MPGSLGLVSPNGIEKTFERGSHRCSTKFDSSYKVSVLRTWSQYQGHRYGYMLQMMNCVLKI